MNGSPAQIRAIETLARHHLNDRESLEQLIRLFPETKSAGVQVAIASVLIRADYGSIATPKLAEMLRQSRLKSPQGENLIDVLIRRLPAP
jgi:hypothetical protein